MALEDFDRAGMDARISRVLPSNRAVGLEVETARGGELAQPSDIEEGAARAGLGLAHIPAQPHGSPLKVQSDPDPDGGSDIPFMFTGEGHMPSSSTPDPSDAR